MKYLTSTKNNPTSPRTDDGADFNMKGQVNMNENIEMHNASLLLIPVVLIIIFVNYIYIMFIV
jgi:hypothetical protein